jgi:hypothetical protein
MKERTVTSLKNACLLHADTVIVLHFNPENGELPPKHLHFQWTIQLYILEDRTFHNRYIIDRPLASQQIFKVQ